MPDIFRQAASLIVLRPRGEGYEFLLVHKPRKKDAWQIPQGGIEEGETVAQAALRELQEEASLTGKIIGESDRVYEYTFPASYRRFRPDNIKGQQIHFVFALVQDDAKVQVDNNEIDDFVWIDLSELGKYIKRKAYAELIRVLHKEAMEILKKK